MVKAKQQAIGKMPVAQALWPAEEVAPPRKGTPAAQPAASKKVWGYIKKTDLQDRFKR
ncbi:hypothetical protein OOZ63_14415 [Paucibacter sp. PLA-PC-4]|uniref:hypothetical protein n=1 Tax=Paucibacter sp. PLA-PC-4 TaxID=2993655 RepID=UPI002248F38D|nr:hypothetical protein [Paucibacter sp. PLA-PC-4]MCX2863022.1 hypothetical protein [Paucibacter sp. PLA-PC-4]